MRMEGVRPGLSAPARRHASLGCRSGRRGATTCYQEPAQKGASERKATEREAHETPAKARMRGNQRKRTRAPGPIDKLGVTGSSPVPPIAATLRQ